MTPTLPLLLAFTAGTAALPLTRSVSAVPAHPISGGKGTASILFGSAEGATEGAMTLLVLQPGASVPEHVHESSVELLYVLSGEAEMTVDGKTLHVGPETGVRIPKGARHSARVVGEKALRGLQVYTPGGPEQRFVPPAR
jgi:quercetin dioxygenase-like cupin family protein